MPGAEPERELTQARYDGRPPYQIAVIPGQGGRLAVASDEVLEQRNGAGCAVMQQEMAKVEVAVSSAHFTEVDDAGVPAPVVEPDMGGIEVAVRQVPSGDRPLPLLVDDGLQRLEVPATESAGQPPRPPPGQVTGHELGVAGQFGAQPRQAVPAQPAEALNLDGVDQGSITTGRPHRPARLLVGSMAGQAPPGQGSDDQERAVQIARPGLDVHDHGHPHAQPGQAGEHLGINGQILARLLGDPEVVGHAVNADPVHHQQPARRGRLDRHRARTGKHPAHHRPQQGDVHHMLLPYSPSLPQRPYPGGPAVAANSALLLPGAPPVPSRRKARTHRPDRQLQATVVWSPTENTSPH